MKFEETTGDLFFCDSAFALVHCVGRDFRMGAGIAVGFRLRFGGVDELKAQGKQVGQVSHLVRANRSIFYLVTKERSAKELPTLENLTTCIQELYQSCIALGITKLAMPKIGCGLDRLDWAQVRAVLQEVFKDSEIHIRVYSLN